MTLRADAAAKYQRDDFGLIKNISYVFHEDGSIDWRSMVKPEFIYPNKGWFSLRNQPAPTSIEGLHDKQLSILLGGIKDLAKIRGYSSVSYDVFGDGENVVAKCRIVWIGNYETNFKEISFEDAASASVNNSDDFCHKFLETIACNRAFVRTVRNFLGINIVGDDEIDKSQKSISVDSPDLEPNSSVLKPHGTLEKAALKSGISSFEDFVEWLRGQWKAETYQNSDAKTWQDYSDIPPKECRKIIPLLKKTQ